MARVLFVDDNIDLHRVMQALLRLAGHEGVCVASGEEALSNINAAPPDIVLLDLMMPGISGLDVLQTLRADPRTRQLPVIMFSGVSDDAHINQLMSAGANEFWVKGKFDFDELKARLARYVSPR
jgi:CheY-like chemotaxis protein